MVGWIMGKKELDMRDIFVILYECEAQKTILVCSRFFHNKLAIDFACCVTWIMLRISCRCHIFYNEVTTQVNFCVKFHKNSTFGGVLLDTQMEKVDDYVCNGPIDFSV